MTQKKIQGDQLDLTLADGSALTGVDADLLQGQNGAFYRNAGNMNAGTLPAARLTGTYNIGISGNAATATNATNATNATTASNALALGGVAAANYAQLANPVFTGNPRGPTPTFGDNDTSLATTAFVQAAVAASTGVTTHTSPALGIANVVAWSHTLGSEPDDVSVILQCVIPDAGWPAGSRILASDGQYSRQTKGDVNENFGLIAEISSTIVRLNFTTFFAIPTYGVGNNSINILNRANWVLYIKAFKF